MENVLVTVIIPAYNEQSSISECLFSVEKQTYKNIEIIVVDDGSTDRTEKIILPHKVKVIKTNHCGPGNARNVASKIAKGEILVFVDADMFLKEDYVEKLIKPILIGHCIGTYSSAEYIANYDNIWSKCWNINNNILNNKRNHENNDDSGKVFRAIKKKEYIGTKGFDFSKGYFDDMTIYRNTLKAVKVRDAYCYHQNPDTLIEVFYSARWIGRAPNFTLSLRNVLKYSVINSLRFSYKKIYQGAPIHFLVFKIIFDIGLLCGIIFKNPKSNYSK